MVVWNSSLVGGKDTIVEYQVLGGV
jgi:hypothetical protein